MTVLSIGDRVQLHPATDYWMQGDRYGEITGTTRMHNLRIRLDKSGSTVCVHPSNVVPIRDVQLRAAVRRGLLACSGCCLDNEDEQERVLHSIMAELSLCGLRDTQHPPAMPSDDSHPTSDTVRPPR